MTHQKHLEELDAAKREASESLAASMEAAMRQEVERKVQQALAKAQMEHQLIMHHKLSRGEEDAN